MSFLGRPMRMQFQDLDKSVVHLLRADQRRRGSGRNQGASRQGGRWNVGPRCATADLALQLLGHFPLETSLGPVTRDLCLRNRVLTEGFDDNNHNPKTHFS